MIVPSIDLLGGHAVQLIGGKEQALDAGPPGPILESFALAGDVAVIDLDAALSQGSNKDLIRGLLPHARCRVGGGIRDVDTAIEWLDAGAHKIILGTAARPEILSQLPKERVIAALDANKGEVVVDGWRTATGKTVLERMEELHPYVSGFLVTFVEREGRLGGIDLERVREVVSHAHGRRVTVAGGVSTAQEVAAIDRMGADCQVGMALYKNHLSLAEGIAAPLRSDRADGLWPTVICDENDQALGLAYSNHDSLQAAVEQRKGIYFSRSKMKLWVKGATSGATQELLRVDLDCDRDTLRFIVKQQEPGFCHENTRTCWGHAKGTGQLLRRLEQRRQQAPEGSYSKRLFDDAELLGAKLREEANELANASERADVIHEAADVLFFTLTAMARQGISLYEVEQELDRRALKVTRRPGDAKDKAQSSEKSKDGQE